MEFGKVFFTGESQFRLRALDGRHRVWRKDDEHYSDHSLSFNGDPIVGLGGIPTKDYGKSINFQVAKIWKNKMTMWIKESCLTKWHKFAIVKDSRSSYLIIKKDVSQDMIKVQMSINIHLNESIKQQH